MTEREMLRRTHTLTKREIEMLLEITAHRHPSDPRAESMTLRELIREEWARTQKEKKPHG